MAFLETAGKLRRLCLRLR
uniref:Uncharacterized protein n=1 Tax=Rhizophora mucronata TaxID=61149 RepID=A0A2P2NST4_RHIMU